MIKVILLGGIVLSIGLYAWYVLYTETTRIHKFILAGMIVAFVGAYSVLQQQDANLVHTLLLEFHNDKPLVCDGIEVTKKDFNLVTGTNTFLGKASSSYKAHAIALEDCTIP